MYKRWFFWFFLLPICMFGVLSPHYLRNSSPPYISGDGFREYADFAYDEIDRSLNPEVVQEANTVFVKTDLLKDFFEKIHPFIQHPYILITHNSDDPAPGPFEPFLDDPKIIAWFGHNGEIAKHSKFVHIPIGMANRDWPFGNVDTFQKYVDSKDSQIKTHLLFMNYTIQNHYNERFPLFRLLGYSSFVFRTGKKLFKDYLADIVTCKFVVSPRGIAIDTHRTWESLYLGVYPIVRSSTINPLYEDLPIIVVKKWEEVHEDFLNQKYAEFKQKTFPMEKAYLNYWLKKITACKEAYLAKK